MTWKENPYIIGIPIAQQKSFFGRKELFEFIEDNLRQDAKVILLHGQRRIGKSSVLRHIPQFVTSEEFVFVRFDLQDQTRLPLWQILYNLAVEICDRLNLTQLYFLNQSQLEKQPQLFGSEFLAQIFQALNGKKLVLLLDEFDVLSEPNPTVLTQTFFSYLQSIIDKYPQLFIIPVVGRRLEDMPTLLSLFKGAPNQKIGLLDKHSAKQLIVQPARELLEYTNEAVEAILELSAGHPYFTQVICHALFAHARDEQRFEVTRQDVEGIVEKAIEIGEAGLVWFRDGLPIAERIFFTAVALCQPTSSREPLTLLKEFGVVLTEQFYQAGNLLVDWGFLEEVENPQSPATKVPTYKVTIELVRRWLVKQHSLRRDIWELDRLDPDAHEIYLMGEKRYKQGNTQKAQLLYEQVLDVNPNHLSTLFAFAETAFHSENWEKAVSLYSRTYQIDPLRSEDKLVRSLLSYGSDLIKQQKPELAKEQFQQVLKIQPNNFVAIDQLKEIAAKRSLLDIQRFVKACNPAKTLVMENEQDRRYYIDFSDVRDGRLIEALGRTITRVPFDSTCQLYTGQIGSGKSTELLRLKYELQQQGFHVVYFESSEDMDMADLDVSDILFAIARHVSESLEAVEIKLKPNQFTNLFAHIKESLQIAVDLSGEIDLSACIGKITSRSKDNPKFRQQIREHLVNQTARILQAINTDILLPAKKQLHQQGKKGLVVIVDNFDKVNTRLLPRGRSQPEYLFIDRGSDLRQLNCHVVYTLPQVLMFSNDTQRLTDVLGGGVAPKVLSVVPVQLRDGSECDVGMALLRQVVLARAFPEVDDPELRLNLVTEVFDRPETLDRLCRISGGHLRKLVSLLYECLILEDPPLSRECIESVIANSRHILSRSVKIYEWDLLGQVVQKQTAVSEEEYQTLLRNMFVFEYEYKGNRWFGINPLLAEEKDLN